MRRRQCDSPAGFVYFEPCTVRSTQRPPDVLVCHPEIGLLVIEVKGYPVEIVQGLKAGSLIVRRRGFNRPENPLRQAEDAMFGGVFACCHR